MYSNDVSKLQSAGHMKIIGQELTIKNMKCQIECPPPMTEREILSGTPYMSTTPMYFSEQACVTCSELPNSSMT